MKARRCERRATLLAFAVGLVALPAPTQADAATQIGETFGPAVFFCGADTLIQSGSPGGQYAAAFAGVLTSWSYTAGSPAPQRKLKVAHPVAGNRFRIVGESELMTAVPDALNTYPVQIPVQPGDVIGFYQSASGDCPVRASVFGHSFHYLSGADPPPGSEPLFASPVSDQLGVSAILEPDCDSDGFGDESQDQHLSPGGDCPRAERSLTVDADKSKVKKGGKVLVSGHLDAPGNEAVCQSGQTVELQRRKPGQTVFTTLAQLQTTATGNFSAREKVKKTFEYRAEVAQTETCGAGVSNTEKVKVKKKK